MIRLLLLLLCCTSLPLQASEVIKLEEMAIQGHSETPAVVHITPWREPPGTGKLTQDAVSFRDQWLHTLDDERLRHEMALPATFLRPQNKPSTTE